MSHAIKRVAFPEAFKPKKLSEIKDRDEKRWRIQDAVNVFKRSIEIKREMAEIEADKELHAAVQAVLEQESSDIKKAKSLVS